MTAFEHVATLLSFVYALALTHLLSRTGELVIARERVKFSGLTALGMVNVGLLICENWIAMWDLRSVSVWDLASIAVQLLFATSVYLAGVLIAPKPPEEGVLDMDDFFWKQRVYFYGTLIILLILSLLTNADFLKSANVGLFLKENAFVLVYFIPVICGLLFTSRWVQWLAGLSVTALTIEFGVYFDATLH